MINALYCIAYNKDSYVMQWIVVHCIVIALLMISIFVQCIGIALLMISNYAYREQFNSSSLLIHLYCIAQLCL